MASQWTIPVDMWESRTVAILASGPSMSQAVADQVQAAGLPTIVTNDTFRLALWADMLYAADAQWWDVNLDALDFKGHKVTSHNSCHHPIWRLKQTGWAGYDPDPQCVRTGGNSGYQAIHVAIRAGAAQVLMCGFDMHGSHWFGEHKPPLRNPLKDTQALRTRGFRYLSKIPGVDIVNCTPGSAIDCFRRMDLTEALAEVTEKA